MSSMFSVCSSLSNLNLSNFDTKNVIELHCMFYQCSSLKKTNVITKDNKIINEYNNKY